MIELKADLRAKARLMINVYGGTKVPPYQSNELRHDCI
jgi:hypothetical protein